jgi:septal ring factor EnvC (AmiA/AmiB activator)
MRRLSPRNDDTQIKELEEEKRQAEQQVMELKAKCEAIEKRESERRAMEERKHSEEIAFLKKTNVQLKVRACDCSYLVNTHSCSMTPPFSHPQTQLEGILSPTKK